MTRNFSRFRQAIAAALIGLFAVPLLAAQHDTIRVLVWDERQPKQAQAYDNFLGNEVAAYLKKQEGLEVCSVGLDDPDQGISAKGLDQTDVLIWWGHVRQDEVTQEVISNVVQRIKAGKARLYRSPLSPLEQPFHRSDGRAHAERRAPALSRSQDEVRIYPHAGADGAHLRFISDARLLRVQGRGRSAAGAS